MTHFNRLTSGSLRVYRRPFSQLSLSTSIKEPQLWNSFQHWNDTVRRVCMWKRWVISCVNMLQPHVMQQSLWSTTNQENKCKFFSYECKKCVTNLLFVSFHFLLVFNLLTSQIMKELLTMSHDGQSLDLLWCYDMLHRHISLMFALPELCGFQALKTL